MLLYNVNIVGQEGQKHIHIESGRIRNITHDEKLVPWNMNDDQLSFDGALAFPGLINSHDHLDFNLFPQTGNQIYRNYVEWGADIQVENKEQINGILKIPERLRTSWGVYKNLLTGITTVVNHGKKLFVDHALINVFQECQAIHSINREKFWRFQLNKLHKRKQPVVIHIGEGTDVSTHQEIDQLLKWNHFKRAIIGIHGVAMNEKQASLFKALVWCPASNVFLYGKTTAINILKQKTTIVFGTDSTLTASWNIWDHLRHARGTGFTTDAELFDMLTIHPAKIWGLDYTGQLAKDQWADVVIAKQGNSPAKWDTFYNLNPESLLMIFHRGNIRLFDAELFDQVKKTNTSLTEFSKVYIKGIAKYVQGDIPGLMNEIRKFNPDINFPVTID